MSSYQKAALYVVFSFYLLFHSACKKTEFNPLGNPVQTNTSNIHSGKPNIILFMADDVGYDVPEFTGGKSYQTPTLNFMAAQGMQFNQCFSHPDGFPSRLAYLTGKYNFRNYTTWGDLPDDELTIANMLQDNGYVNCFVGKWQYNGGGERIRSAGFDKYRVFLPFKGNQRIRRYKSPLLYQAGNFLPDSETIDRYSEDMFYEYVSDFIDSSINKSFYIQYSFNLCAAPYVPSPDHPDYTSWNPETDDKNDDTAYFKSMVGYMDKIMGQVIQKVNRKGLLNNTIFLFIGDNATQERIFSNWRDTVIEGTKTQATRPGTTTPFVAFWPGRVLSKRTNSTLIDYTDFFVTLADITGITNLTTYGQLDGTSFYDDLFGVQGEDRDWVFCHWDNGPQTALTRYIHESRYKLYDRSNQDNNFYDIITDIWESNPIPDASMTVQQRAVKNRLKAQMELLR